MALTVDHDLIEHARADADLALGALLVRVRRLPADAVDAFVGLPRLGPWPSSSTADSGAQGARR